MKVKSGLFFGMVLLVAAAQADPRMWGESGIPIRQGMHLRWNENDQGMARDASGNTLLVWTEKSTGQRDVRAQLVNPLGAEQWVAGGVNVTPELHHQDCPVAVAVPGGWIIAWVDYRGNPDCVNNPYYNYYDCGEVYAQKLDYSGNRLWPDNDFTGVAVRTNTPGLNKFSLGITSDGAGGAMIAWNEPGFLYTQRVTANGDLAWTEAVQVVDSVNVYDLAVAPATDGSMLLAWYTNYSGIFASRVMTDGSLSWGPNGAPVQSLDNSTYGLQITPDGTDGCYVIWSDHRNNEGQIYAQHMTGVGQPVWVVNGIPLSTTGGWEPKVAMSMSGGEPDGMLAIWQHWEQDNQYAIYAQRVSPEGVAAWAEGGIPLANLQPGWRTAISLSTDHNGGLVAAWQHSQPGPFDMRVYAARLRSNGTQAWGSDPVPVGWSSAYQAPAVAGDFGIYLVSYLGVDSLGMESVHYQMLDHGNGARLLGPDGASAVEGVAGYAEAMQVAPMGNHRTAVFWSDGRLDSRGWGRLLYYQIVGADGQVERALNGERLVTNLTGYLYGYQYQSRTCDDGAGGLFVSYQDNRTGTTLIRVSHISADGAVVGPDSGMVPWWSQGYFDQYYGYIRPDGQGGCYVAWSQYAQNYWVDAYIMRLNSDLQRVWNQPVRLTQTVDDDYLYGLVSSVGNGCIAVWQSGELADYNISAAGIGTDGTVLWNGALCDAPGDQNDPDVVSDGEGGAYVAWHDSRVEANDGDIYAQRVAADGTMYWAVDGIPVYAGADAQWTPQVTLDSGDRLCVTWLDFHNAVTHSYAQRLSPQGDRLWGNNGVRVSTSIDYSLSAVVASARDGILPVWEDYRPGTSNLFATHLDSTGDVFDDPFWRPDSGGAVVEPAFAYEYSDNPFAASDGWGGCVVSWTKWEAEYEFQGDIAGGPLYTSDVYAQRLFDYATSAREQPGLLPREFALYQNFPNPFNPATEIRFDLPKPQRVKLTVFDLLGREVRVLVDEPMAAGNHQVNFDAASLPSGLYVYRLQAGEYTRSRKMVVLK